MAIKIFKRTEFKGKSNSDPRITVNTVSGLFYFSSTALDVLEIIEKVNVLFAFDPEEKRAFIIHDEEKEPDSFILKREKTSRNTYKSGFTNKSLGSEFGKIFSKEVYKNKLMMIVEPADQGGYYELLTLPASIMKLKSKS